jgi:phage recombination protein Bet
MSYSSKQNYPPKTRCLPMPVEAKQIYELSEQSWNVLTEVTFPTAKTPEAIMMALDYCRTRKLDIFKKPVHIVPMWSAALGRSVETVWSSIMEIQTTASRTGLWAGMDRPVWGPDKTHTFTGRYKDDNEQWQETSVEVTFPEWVAVTVYRLVNGQRCAFTEEVYWLEAYSTVGGKSSQLPTAMWIKRPKGQLAKCGKAASLRTAFPEECGYSAEEMEGKNLDDLNDATVINGQATRLAAEKELIKGDARTDSGVNGTAQVIDLSRMSPKVQKAVAELIRRTVKAGAWQAAYDYANNKFSGLDLTFAITELEKASAAYKQTCSNQNHQDDHSIDDSAIPPLTTAKSALIPAREHLVSVQN